jgi:ADP-ribose pyrophosphatase YjhB (NUDIX family)
MMKQTKHAIAFVVWNQDRDKVLAVQRPGNDEDLPDVWGLPAGSLREGETFEDCVVRSGREKLGVDVCIIQLLAEGESERTACILRMKEYEVEIVQGEPSVPQPLEGMTQYQRWQWAEPALLQEAAQKGSLCSRLFLEQEGLRSLTSTRRPRSSSDSCSP